MAIDALLVVGCEENRVRRFVPYFSFFLVVVASCRYKNTGKMKIEGLESPFYSFFVEVEAKNIVGRPMI